MPATANKTEITQEPTTGFDWYFQTELASDILNSLLVEYGTTILKEQSKHDPDNKLIYDCNRQIDHIQHLLHYPDTFASLESMEAIISQYGPVLKTLPDE